MTPINGLSMFYLHWSNQTLSPQKFEKIVAFYESFQNISDEEQRWCLPIMGEFAAVFLNSILNVPAIILIAYLHHKTFYHNVKYCKVFIPHSPSHCQSLFQLSFVLSIVLLALLRTVNCTPRSPSHCQLCFQLSYTLATAVLIFFIG